jgi:hypothetical protein
MSDKVLVEEFKKQFPEKRTQEETDRLMNKVRLELRLKRTAFIRTDYVSSFKYYDVIVDELEKQLNETFKVIFVDSPTFFGTIDKVYLDRPDKKLSKILEMYSFRLCLKYSSTKEFVSKIINLIKLNHKVNDNDVLYVYPRDLEIYPMVNDDNEDCVYFKIRLNGQYNELFDLLA